MPPTLALVVAAFVPASATRGADPAEEARLVVAWPAGPLEVRLAWDRPADPSLAARLVKSVFQFDTHQKNLEEWRRVGSPRLIPPLGTLNVVAARFDEPRRTLILTTDPHPREAVYSASLPLSKTPGDPTTVVYDLTGVSASWTPGGDGTTPTWEGWWPHLDPETSRRLTRGSLEHERGFALLTRPGRLTLESLVVLPRGRIHLELTSTGPLEATLGGENPGSSSANTAGFVVESTGEPSLLFLTIGTRADGPPPSLRIGLRKGDETASKPLARQQQLVPWAPTAPPEPAPPPPPGFNVAGGDPARGEALFFGEQAKCSTCHQVANKGGAVGPDLSDRSGRDRNEVLRDIVEPSASIHPDFMAHVVALKDGRVLAGVVRAVDAGTLRVTDTDAKTTLIRREDVEELRPSGTSIMPVGLAGALGEDRLRDLLAFLTAPRPQTQNPPHGRPR